MNKATSIATEVAAAAAGKRPRRKTATCFVVVLVCTCALSWTSWRSTSRLLSVPEGQLEYADRVVENNDNDDDPQRELHLPPAINDTVNSSNERLQQLSVPHDNETAETASAGNVTRTPSSPTSTVPATASPPRLFIHVGPVKTGSSSIQCNLQVNPFLAESSYEFMGRSERVCPPTPHRQTKGRFLDAQTFVFRYILRGWLSQPQFQDFVHSFIATYQDRAAKGMDTIISAEEFCGLLRLPPLTNTTSPEDHRLVEFANLLNSIPQTVTFQVMYRHHFDWAYSAYTFYEIFNKKYASMRRDKLQSILGKQQYFSGVDTGMCSPYEMWTFLRDRLLPLLDRADLQVLDFHAANEHNDELATRYICGLPHSAVACHRTRNELRLERARSTPVDVVHADRIAKEAWDRGLYGAAAAAVANKRQQVAALITDHVRTTLNTTFLSLAKECLPDDVVSSNLETSIRVGKEMLGAEFDSPTLEQHFARNQASHKFCSVNATSLLLEPEWQTFFRNLKVSS